jgi:hypothetical protein
MNGFSRKLLLATIVGSAMATAIEIWTSGNTTAAWVWGGLTALGSILSVAGELLFTSMGDTPSSAAD